MALLRSFLMVDMHALFIPGRTAGSAIRRDHRLTRYFNKDIEGASGR